MDTARPSRQEKRWYICRFCKNCFKGNFEFLKHKKKHFQLRPQLSSTQNVITGAQRAPRSGVELKPDVQEELVNTDDRTGSQVTTLEYQATAQLLAPSAAEIEYTITTNGNHVNAPEIRAGRTPITGTIDQREPFRQGLIQNKVKLTERSRISVDSPVLKVVLRRCDSFMSGLRRNFYWNFSNISGVPSKKPDTSGICRGNSQKSLENSATTAIENCNPKDRNSRLLPPSDILEGSVEKKVSAECLKQSTSNRKLQFLQCRKLTCRKSFLQNSSLIRHARKHTGQKPFKCSECSKSFTKKTHLTRHTRTHTGEKPYKCVECSTSFSRRNILTEHTRTHTGEKPFQCHFCSKAFATSGYLKAHLRQHTGEKPFQCHFCSKACAKRGDLKAHLRQHTGEKPFQCHVCNKACATSGNLKSHLRQHTGDKPYQCEFCDNSFAYNSCLKKHLRMHTEQKNSNATYVATSIP